MRAASILKLVFRLCDGWLAFCHRGFDLAYRIFDNVRQIDQSATADRKHWWQHWRRSEINSCSASLKAATVCGSDTRLLKVG
jgi:hypothetical protein